MKRIVLIVALLAIASTALAGDTLIIPKIVFYDLIYMDSTSLCVKQTTVYCKLLPDHQSGYFAFYGGIEKWDSVVIDTLYYEIGLTGLAIRRGR